jgi:hypothetical protein
MISNKMNYEETIKLIGDIGNGWRLPTIKEFKFLQDYYNKGILNFKKDVYWSSEDHEYNPFGYYFFIKKYGGIPEEQRLCVRLVRNI